MTHGLDAASAPAGAAPAAEPRIPGALGSIDRTLRLLNHGILVAGGVALVGACCVLTFSVVVRYALHRPTEWQDETAVFLIVGAVFLSAAGVQAKRGHVAIEAVSGLLPPAVNRARLLLADVVSLAFVAFFAWKSWELFHEAWIDGITSDSTWGPPLWIPYSLMSVGMSLLAVQLAVQIVESVAYGPGAAGWANQKIGMGADLTKGLPAEGPLRGPAPGTM